MSPMVPASSKVIRGEQSSGFAPMSKLEDILILRKHQFSLINNKKDIAANPMGVSVVLVVSNLTLMESCHTTTAKLQVAFFNLPAS